ncbi:MAG TPA: hypothetical protein VMG08_09650 [Allosphingosinicella sp.]|nr:hypothetical protein [Allosphingosinicella sp.]
MYSHSDIEEAVASGALTADQAASLRNFVARRTGTPTADEEHVRWLQGFNDYYVFASSIVLIIGLGWLGSKIEVGRGPSFFIPLLIGLASWGLSEYFVAKKRLALTGITLAFVLVYSTYFTVMLLAAQALGSSSGPETGKIVSMISALVAAGVAFMHWKRFDEPVAISLIAGAGAIALMSLLSLVASNDPEGTVAFLVLTLIGLGTLFYAQIWEARDIHRTSRKADIAFWLHMTAAWETLIGLSGLIGLTQGYISQGAAIGAIVLFIVAVLAGLVFDRRVWVLGAAWPFGAGLYTLIRGDRGGYSPYGGGYGDYGSSYGGYSPYGMGGGSSTDSIMLTVLIVGVILVVLGMFWTQIRGALGGLAAPLAGKVPPTSHTQNEGQTFE